MLSGTVTIKVETKGASTESVRFFIDEPVSTEPTVTDSAAPFELRLDTTTLSDGPHELTAVTVARGARGRTELVLEARFVVNNSEANQPPSVEAGAGRTAVVDDPIELVGVVADDGRPGGVVTVTWQLVEGPAPVVFSHPNEPTTDATFATEGSYELELTASDGLAVGSDRVEIEVQVPETAPPPDPSPPSPPPAPEVGSCLDDASGIVVLDGVFESEYHNRDGQPAGTAIDARTARFEAAFDTSEDDPVTLMNIPELCWSGGVIDNQIPDDTDDWDVYHSSQGMYIRSAEGFTVENVTIRGVGDGIRIQEESDGFVIRGSYFEHTGDDAIENDILQNGTLIDNLFDWAYVFYSARLASKDEGRYDGSDNTVVMDGNLVALRPQNAVYKGDRPGHGGFFKMDDAGVSPRLVLRNNVFLATQAPNHTGIDLTAGGAVTEAVNNIIVWLGEGPYPEAVPPGWTLTRDITVWEDARAAWLARHPEIVPASR